MDPGYNELNRQKIESNAALLHIPVTIFESNIFSVANNTDKNPCYLCARMRRGHLYSKAKELGCNKIALGHHFNDVIETTVMSMFYGSQLQAMPPKLHSTSFPGMTLIRPMYCIREEDILAWKRYNDLEFIQCACRFTENCTMCDNGGGGSKRQETKLLLRRLKRDNPNIENSISAASMPSRWTPCRAINPRAWSIAFWNGFMRWKKWQLTLSCEVLRKIMQHRWYHKQAVSLKKREWTGRFRSIPAFQLCETSWSQTLTASSRTLNRGFLFY